MNVASFIVDNIITSTKDTYLRKQYINSTDYKGRTPLFYAVAEGRLGVARLLIERGANVEVVTNERHLQPGSTALMACAEKNTWECSKLLIQKGADILVVRQDGADATYIAARYGHHKIIQQFVESDYVQVIVNRPTFRGRTPLLTAAFHGHVKVCQILLENRGNIDHQDVDNLTALICASSEGHLDLVKWLVRNGANINKRDKFRKTALTSAEANAHMEVVTFLKKM